MICFLQGSEEEEEEIKEDKVEEQSKADDTGDESSVEDNDNPLNSSEEEKLADSSDSLKDFIVEEDEQKNDKEQEEEGENKDKAFLSHLPRQCKTMCLWPFVCSLKRVDVSLTFKLIRRSHVSILFTVITGSQLTHFQVVVKALLINVLDSTFLSSLYSTFIKLFLLFLALNIRVCVCIQYIRAVNACSLFKISVFLTRKIR